MASSPEEELLDLYIHAYKTKFGVSTAWVTNRELVKIRYPVQPLPKRPSQTLSDTATKPAPSSSSSSSSVIIIPKSDIETFQLLEPAVNHIHTACCNFKIIEVLPEAKFSNQAIINKLNPTLRNLCILIQTRMHHKAKASVQPVTRYIDEETQTVRYTEKQFPIYEPIYSEIMNKGKLLAIRARVDIYTYPYYVVRVQGNNCTYDTVYCQKDVVEFNRWVKSAAELSKLPLWEIFTMKE